MTSTIKTALRLLVLLVGFTILYGCASSAPRPVQDLEAATAALQSARASGAPEHATQQWQVAQEKLGRANQLLEQNQNIDAQRALQQATVDANLAAAMAQLQQRVAEQSALQQEISQLQKRIEEVELNSRGTVQQ